MTLQVSPAAVTSLSLDSVSLGQVGEKAAGGRACEENGRNEGTWVPERDGAEERPGRGPERPLLSQTLGCIKSRPDGMG